MSSYSIWGGMVAALQRDGFTPADTEAIRAIVDAVPYAAEIRSLLRKNSRAVSTDELEKIWQQVDAIARAYRNTFNKRIEGTGELKASDELVD